MREEWTNFAGGKWESDIDVRDFIQKNYTPYEGDESFLADATDKTKHLWKYLDDNYLAVERKQRVYDVDTQQKQQINCGENCRNFRKKSARRAAFLIWKLRL